MLDRLSKGDRISLGGAALLFIALFFPWYGIKASGLDGVNLLGAASLDAFDAFKFADIVLLALAVGAGALIVLIAIGKVDRQYHRFIETIGGTAAIVVLLRLIFKPDSGIPGIDVTLKWGIFAALIGAAAVAAGQYLQRTDKL